MISFEESSPYELNQRLSVSRLLHYAKTEHQELIIFENPVYGRVLALDGMIQTTELDEFVYHEMLVHVALFAHGSAKRVLIIGGGDGGALRTALAHPIDHATLVEIDRTVVDLAREHLPSICGGAFEDPRTRLLIADGARFLEETAERFDAIIIDSTDPVGPAEALFNQPFYAACQRCLQPGGILVTQAGVPFVQSDELRRSSCALRGLFADATAYVGAVPTYNGGLMTFGWATDQPSYREQPLTLIRQRYDQAGIATRYYNPDVHQACFALPTYIRDLIEG